MVLTTGIGSMPGTSSFEATAVISGELSLPHLPELPQRGPGADLIGRTAALVESVATDFSVDTVPTGWRLSDRPGGVGRRALSFLGEDLDVAEERYGGQPGPFKLQLAGPWTMLASLENRSGQPLLSDPGIVREYAAALLLAATAHLSGVARRLPDRELWLQLDEPLLPVVLGGGIRRASKWSALPPVPVAEGRALLEPLAQLDRSLLHCCARFPFEVAGDFSGVSLDLLRYRDEETDHGVGETVESGRTLVAGVVPSLGVEHLPPGAAAANGYDHLQSLWSRTGLVGASLRDIVISPTCGLAGATPAGVRASLDAAKEVAHRIETT